MWLLGAVKPRLVAPAASTSMFLQLIGYYKKNSASSVIAPYFEGRDMDLKLAFGKVLKTIHVECHDNGKTMK